MLEEALQLTREGPLIQLIGFWVQGVCWSCDTYNQREPGGKHRPIEPAPGKCLFYDDNIRLRLCPRIVSLRVRWPASTDGRPFIEQRFANGAIAIAPVIFTSI
jgi:hypothetical protein